MFFAGLESPRLFDSAPARNYINRDMLDPIQKKCSSLGFRQAKRVMIFVVGMTVVLIGVAMLVLPGPGILVLAGGLAILGVEFEWARRWLRKARRMLDKATKKTNHAGK